MAGAAGVALGVAGVDAAVPGAGEVGAEAGWLAAGCSAFCGGWFLLQPATRRRPASESGSASCVSLAWVIAFTRMPQLAVNLHHL